MKKYHKWTKHISLKSAGFKLTYYKKVHYCADCGIEMPKLSEVAFIIVVNDIYRKTPYHHNRVLCNRCETKWNDGNKKQGERIFDTTERQKRYLEYKKQKDEQEAIDETEWHDI